MESRQSKTKKSQKQTASKSPKKTAAKPLKQALLNQKQKNKLEVRKPELIWMVPKVGQSEELKISVRA